MLLKIGKQYITSESVLHYTDTTDWENNPVLTIYIGDYSLVVLGDERLALLSYLDSMAVDVLAVYAEKRKPECETCGDTGAIAIRGDDDVPCDDCKREGL